MGAGIFVPYMSESLSLFSSSINWFNKIHCLFKSSSLRLSATKQLIKLQPSFEYSCFTLWIVLAMLQ